MTAGGGADAAQRREHVRAESELPIRIRRLLDDERTGRLDTFALDVSGGGLRVAGPDVLAVDDRIEFELALPGGEPIAGRARVARRAADGTHGIEIEWLPAGDRERLVRHVFERQRELLRERRAREERIASQVGSRSR